MTGRDDLYTKFIWRIENFSCIKEGIISSPFFRWKSTSWEVIIHVKDIKNGSDSLSVEVHQSDNFHDSVRCLISFLDFRGFPLLWKEKFKERLRLTTPKYTLKFENFVKRTDIFGSRRNEFLPKDNLTLQCCLQISECSQYSWPNIEFQSFFALTQIEPRMLVVKKSFTRGVAYPCRRNNWVESIKINGQLLTMMFFWEAWKLKITVSLIPIHLKVTILMLGSFGKKIQLVNDDFRFEKNKQVWNLETSLSKMVLDCYGNVFLRDGTVSLQFSCTLSGNVTFNSLVDEDKIANNIEPNVDVGHISDPNKCADESVMPIVNVGPTSKHENSSDEHIGHSSNPSDYSKTISQAVKGMYEEGFLSDFDLKVGDRVFPVHKVILGVRSPVFRTMFTTEMKEKEDNCCVIEDVNGDTIERMLEFIYSDRVADDMGWESASSLYEAADKYTLETLKQRCSAILRRGLCSTSVLYVLKLADMHHDQELKSAAFEFISHNDKDIVDSERWKIFEEENKQLAFDTFRSLYLYYKKNG